MHKSVPISLSFSKSTSFVEFFSKSEHSNRASMRRSAATHLNFILCKYYDFITAALKVYSDRQTHRNPVRKTQRNRRSHFSNFRKITLDKMENPPFSFPFCSNTGGTVRDSAPPERSSLSFRSLNSKGFRSLFLVLQKPHQLQN